MATIQGVLANQIAKDLGDELKLAFGSVETQMGHPLEYEVPTFFVSKELLAAAARTDLPADLFQRLRAVLSELGNVAIPPPRQKTFDLEGEILEHALTKCLRTRNDALRNLCSSVRRFRDATLKEECKGERSDNQRARLAGILSPESGRAAQPERIQREFCRRRAKAIRFLMNTLLALSAPQSMITLKRCSLE